MFEEIGIQLDKLMKLMELIPPYIFIPISLFIFWLIIRYLPRKSISVN